MKPEVEQAITEIRELFPGHEVQVIPEAQGGAYVIVFEIELGRGFKPKVTWFGFLMTFQYPHADVYPHFIDAGIRKADGTEFRGDGVSGPVTWQGRTALQLSRRSHRWNPAEDTAALKLLKVIEWLKTK